ncbi:MAG: lysylphosphatidylglycerol synthase transmembrane domain-containing protein [Bacteroidota bacterium]
MSDLSISKRQRLQQWLHHKTFNLLIKIVIVGLFLIAIYFQVFARENAADLWATFRQQFNWHQLPYLLAVCLLVPINWGFETYKFKTLMRPTAQLGFWQTYRAILAGITVSLFTPNRVGEVGGRILLVASAHNWQAATATIAGSISQLIVLLAMGFLGAIYFIFYVVQQPFDGVEWMLVGGILLVVLLLSAFYHTHLLLPFARRLPYYSWWKKRLGRQLGALWAYESHQLSIALLFSLLRYLTYSFQYFLMLHFFGINVPLATAVSGIATIFLLQTSIPLPPVVGLLARGEIALGIWGLFSPLSLHILAASFSLFVINLSLPALIGAVFIAKINVLNSLGYDREDNKKEA